MFLFNPRSDAHGYPEAGPLRDPRENFHWQGDALVIGIGNGRRAGGGQQLCPEALINDGLLHLRIFTGEELILPCSAPRRIRKTRLILLTVSPRGLK